MKHDLQYIGRLKCDGWFLVQFPVYTSFTHFHWIGNGENVHSNDTKTRVHVIGHLFKCWMYLWHQTFTFWIITKTGNGLSITVIYQHFPKWFHIFPLIRQFIGTYRVSCECIYFDLFWNLNLCTIFFSHTIKYIILFDVGTFFSDSVKFLCVSFDFVSHLFLAIL